MGENEVGRCVHHTCWGTSSHELRVMVRFDGRSSCKAAHGFLRKAASTKNATREAQLDMSSMSATRQRKRRTVWI
ncbi:hypothetical protein SERLA73DRAFT_189367 [Serpula lacrymans var. lacrymans S7.3]|uniref:Uncharacterized protein n=1 Tax=Serpula lacrymans var. lacrymans (strain S7.3) TaxID=936435 RepID=F8QDG6_SERL3|nr:hypothetical protein SERLA73DRAFT_189367 [Serpula lacrymans var. lacrymans S7.3]